MLLHTAKSHTSTGPWLISKQVIWKPQDVPGTTQGAEDAQMVIYNCPLRVRSLQYSRGDGYTNKYLQE